MKIVRLHLHPYHLPMAVPVQLTGHTFSAKKGWWLVAETDRGNTVRAEIPCLPRVHPIEHGDIPAAMRSAREVVLNVLHADTPHWEHPLFGLLPPTPLPGTLLFALESILLALYHKQFMKHFSLPLPLKVPINELFIPKTFETGTPIASTVKVKLPGLSNPAATLAALLEHRGDCRLRLDPNRTLSPASLQSLVTGLPPENLEYVEDPYPDLSEGLKEFSRFPLALDKELAPALRSRRFPSNTVALVVKPSRDLSLSGTLRLILERKYTVVISSAYETPLGLWPLIHLAAVSKSPCGLDVQKLFRPSPTLPFHPLSGGHIHLLEDLPCVTA